MFLTVSHRCASCMRLKSNSKARSLAHDSSAWIGSDGWRSAALAWGRPVNEIFRPTSRRASTTSTSSVGFHLWIPHPKFNVLKNLTIRNHFRRPVQRPGILLSSALGLVFVDFSAPTPSSERVSTSTASHHRRISSRAVHQLKRTWTRHAQMNDTGWTTTGDTDETRGVLLHGPDHHESLGGRVERIDHPDTVMVAKAPVTTEQGVARPHDTVLTISAIDLQGGRSKRLQ